jgi:hypothetical protein
LSPKKNQNRIPPKKETTSEDNDVHDVYFPHQNHFLSHIFQVINEVISESNFHSFHFSLFKASLFISLFHFHGVLGFGVLWFWGHKTPKPKTPKPHEERVGFNLISLFINYLYIHSIFINSCFLDFCQLNNFFLHPLFLFDYILNLLLQLVILPPLIEDSAVVVGVLFVEFPDLLFHVCNLR